MARFIRAGAKQRRAEHYFGRLDSLPCTLAFSPLRFLFFPSSLDPGKLPPLGSLPVSAYLLRLELMCSANLRNSEAKNFSATWEEKRAMKFSSAWGAV